MNNIISPIQDEYGTVINHQDTFKSIKQTLSVGLPVVFAWTDGEGTQLDILMAYHPVKYGNLQRGMNASSLYVAISGFGMFGFGLNGAYKMRNYICDKLGMKSEANSVTGQALEELINGVCQRLEHEI